MTHRAFVQSLATVAMLTLAFALWPGRKTDSTAPPDEHPGSASLSEVPEPREASVQALTRTKPFGRPAGSAVSHLAAPAPVQARVYSAQVLAMVNQTPLQLRHLMPLRAGEVEKELTPEQYASRLQRAIEVELTFQAARAASVELTPAQQQRVEQVGARHAAELEHYRQSGLTWSSVCPEQVEFEQRLLTAQLLEQNLIVKQTAVSPSPDVKTQARYEQARRALFDQLQAYVSITKPVPGL